MNATEVLNNLRSELEADWSDSRGGYSDFVVRSLLPDDSNLRDYLEIIAWDSHTTPKARRLATRALQEVENDANFLARCGIKAEDLGEPT